MVLLSHGRLARTLIHLEQSEEGVVRLLLSLVGCIALGLAYVPSIGAQAIIGYGINVARAGAAGAATGAAGAGAAGIFKSLEGQMDKAAKGKSSQTSSTARGNPEFDRTDLEKTKDRPTDTRARSVSKSGGQVKTASGVTISGLPATPRPARPSWHAAELATSSGQAPPAPAAPTADPALPPVSNGSADGSSAAAPGVELAASGSPDTPAGPAAISEAPGAALSGGPQGTDSPQLEAAPAHPGILVPRVATIYPNHPVGNDAQAGKHTTEPGDTAGESAAGGLEGVSIEWVMARFGPPLMKFAGIPGAGYSEKYVFRAPDGSRFAVLARDGVVVRVLADGPLPIRAAPIAGCSRRRLLGSPVVGSGHAQASLGGPLR